MIYAAIWRTGKTSPYSSKGLNKQRMCWSKLGKFQSHCFPAETQVDQTSSSPVYCRKAENHLHVHRHNLLNFFFPKNPFVRNFWLSASSLVNWLNIHTKGKDSKNQLVNALIYVYVMEWSKHWIRGGKTRHLKLSSSSPLHTSVPSRQKDWALFMSMLWVGGREKGLKEENIFLVEIFLKPHFFSTLTIQK